MTPGKSLTVLLPLLCLLCTAQPALADTRPEEIAVLKERVRQDEKDADARFDLAMGLARTPWLEQGWQELLKVREMDPGYAQKVLERYEPIAKENPDNIEAWFRLAFGHFFTGLERKDSEARRKALEAFAKVLEIDPKYVWALNYLAYLTYEGGDLAGALAYAERAVQADAENAVAHFLKAQALVRQNRYWAAAPELALAMRLRAQAGFGD